MVPGSQCAACPLIATKCHPTNGTCTYICDADTCPGCCSPHYYGHYPDRWGLNAGCVQDTHIETLWYNSNHTECGVKNTTTGQLTVGGWCQPCNGTGERCGYDSGFCEYTCDGTSCPNGCCQNNTCVVHSAMNNTVCGTATGGEQCVDCLSGNYPAGTKCDTANTGTCVWKCSAETCADGCCDDTFDNCYSPTGNDTSPYLKSLDVMCGNSTSGTLITGGVCINCEDDSKICSLVSGICVNPT